MSVLDVLARPRAGSVQGRQSGPHLRLVPRTRTRPPRVPFVLLVLMLLGVGLVGLLLVNTELQQGAFTMHELEVKLADLRDREAALEREVATLEAPKTLATRAAALGMVPNPNPGFLVLTDGAGGADDAKGAGRAEGKILGDPEPAPSPPPPPRPKPPAGGAGGDTDAGEEPAGERPDRRQPDGQPQQGEQPQQGQRGEQPEHGTEPRGEQPTGEPNEPSGQQEADGSTDGGEG